MRPDLIIRPRAAGSSRAWTVKDPVSLQYYHLSDEEYEIVRQLDRPISLDQLKCQFEQAFPPQKLQLEQLLCFLAHLHELGLLVSESAGQGEWLWSRRGQKRRREWLQQSLNVLCIRFRGMDPEQLLSWLHPRCRWMFSSWWIIACITLIASAALLVAVKFDVVHSRLPDIAQLAAPRNLGWLVLSLALVKILHELGHAVACRHFGGECHELGIMLLCFTPCLYCNVSDSWMLSNKWHRIAIVSAGMCVELVLAAICTWIWWYSQPGLVHDLCLNLMFVCSVSTVLFNANPFLRFDGYYILSDLWNVPNLHSEATGYLRRVLARSTLGLEIPQHRLITKSHAGWLAVFAVTSIMYRLFVIFAILWFCFHVLKPFRLEVIAQILTGVVLAGVFAVPVASAISVCRNPVVRGGIVSVRIFATLIVVGLALLAVVTIPLPFSLYAPVVFEPENAQRVYVAVPGRLTESVRAGEIVQSGQPLARLVNYDVRWQLESLRGQRKQQQLILQNLEFRRVEDAQVGNQIPVASTALADIEGRLESRQRDEQRLVLKAPTAGTVIPPASVSPLSGSLGALQSWRGTPLEERNRGCYLETGTLFCLVGDPRRFEAVLLVDQADRPFIRKGQLVHLVMDAFTTHRLKGTITEIAKSDVKVAPREIAASDDIRVRFDARGNPMPVDTLYRARVALDQQHPALVAGCGGRAKIVSDRRTLAWRLLRSLSRTFK